jgi:selenide, water dikinase
MNGLSPASNSHVLVGVETADDAGVVRLSNDEAVVTTADFITPPFDDPHLFGVIAATNALSDVYAMGGEVLCAINLCLFPKELPLEWGRAILAGANDAVRAAGAALVGGHTVLSPELFFGQAVTGRVSPHRVWRNVGARPGDALLLTKPLGTGVIVSAARKGQCPEVVLRAATDSMTTPNRVAAGVLRQFAVSACTDVTGFGLAGHALNMARGSDVSFELDSAAIPAFDGVQALREQGFTCRGEKDNEKAFAFAVDGAARTGFLFDPQTSGGLLVALPAKHASAALGALHALGIPARQIGQVGEQRTFPLVVI